MRASRNTEVWKPKYGSEKKSHLLVCSALLVVLRFSYFGSILRFLHPLLLLADVGAQESSKGA